MSKWFDATAAVAAFAFVAAAAAQTFPSTRPSEREIDLVCVGDSITESHGVPDWNHNGPAAVLARTLADTPGQPAAVYLANLGKGGTTTADWDGPGGLLARSGDAKIDQLIAAHPHGRLVFSVMLGTNDSANHGPHGAPASAEQYGKTMRAIVAALVGRYPDCVIFLHHPIWYSDNIRVATADYTGDAAHDRLRSYFPVIDAIVAADAKLPERHVYPGDVDAYDHFARNYLTELRPQDGKSGTFYLHPNAKGAAALGTYWATPIARELRSPPAINRAKD